MRFILEGICKVGFGVEIGILFEFLLVVFFVMNFDNVNEVVIYWFFDFFWLLKQMFNIGNEVVLLCSVKVVDDFMYKVIKIWCVEMDLVIFEGYDKVCYFVEICVQNDFKL